jgi:uncharacterized membrane protein YgaE (UPF0421/DUF939 family)
MAQAFRKKIENAIGLVIGFALGVMRFMQFGSGLFG